MALAVQDIPVRLRLANGTRTWVVSICILVSLFFFPATGIGQEQMAISSSRDNPWPDAPLPQRNETTNDVPDAATVSGTVRDATGAVISDAQVRLMLKDGHPLRTAKSDTTGEFTFTTVPAGSYLVRVEAAGFAPFMTSEFTITAEQVYVVPEISLSIAGSATSIEVRPTEVIAAEQIKAEEKQRVLGFAPNFYVSYIPDAAPLTSKQKFSLAAHDSFDWTSFMGASVAAGLGQATNAHSGYGQGATGYGKRWGAAFADARSTDLLSRYVFASLLHQDPRYFYQGTGTRKSRFYHAVSYAFVARSDSGKTMPNYSYLFGDLCGAALSNAYYPSEDRGAGLVFTNAALGISGRMAQGLFSEFIGKRLTSHVPASASTTPNAPPPVTGPDHVHP